MVRPDGIPEDVWRSAMDAAAGLRNAVVWQSNSANEIIATCLASTRLDERERCAKVADDHAIAWGLAMGQQAKEIATAIRKGDT
jgi:hypothetical protein